MTIGERDFYLDLPFHHRSLRRLGEEPPIGCILCGEKNREQIELRQLDEARSG